MLHDNISCHSLQAWSVIKQNTKRWSVSNKFSYIIPAIKCCLFHASKYVQEKKMVDNITETALDRRCLHVYYLYHVYCLHDSLCLYIQQSQPYNACLLSFQHYITDPENTDHRDLFDLVWCMLKYCPKERITLREAFRHPFFARYNTTEEDGGSRAGNQDRERSHSISRWLAEAAS